jgi:hypothetical protein
MLAVREVESDGVLIHQRTYVDACGFSVAVSAHNYIHVYNQVCIYRRE